MSDDYTDRIVKQLAGTQQAQPEQGILSRAWDARPWKGYAQNPPSMAPQLNIALGLIGPRGVNNMSARDLTMAREMSGSSALPPGQGMNVQGAPTATLNQPWSEVAQRSAVMRGAENNNMPSQAMPMMRGANDGPAAPASVGWQGRMSAYDNYIRGLPEGQHPMSYQAFKGMIDGGQF